MSSSSVLARPAWALAAASGVPVVEFEELMGRDHGITITFDDGMRSVHEHALPVLRDHGFPAHVFLATGYVGKDIGWDIEGRDHRFAMLDWSQADVLPPEAWLDFAAGHSWTCPGRVERLFALATDIALRGPERESDGSVGVRSRVCVLSDAELLAGEL